MRTLWQSLAQGCNLTDGYRLGRSRIVGVNRRHLVSIIAAVVGCRLLVVKLVATVDAAPERRTNDAPYFANAVGVTVAVGGCVDSRIS